MLSSNKQNGIYTNRRQIYANKLQPEEIYDLEHMKMNHPYFGYFYGLKKENTKNEDENENEENRGFVTESNVSHSRLLNLTQEGNLTKDSDLLESTVYHSDTDNNSISSENVISPEINEIDNSNRLKNDFFRKRVVFRQPAIVDLPQDKLGDVKNQTEFLFGKHIVTTIRVNHMLQNNESLQPNSSKQTDKLVMIARNRLLNLLRAKKFKYNGPDIEGYRQEGNLLKSSPLQRIMAQSFREQRKGVSKRFSISDAQQNIPQSNSFINGKYKGNDILQQQRRNSYKESPILSRYRSVLRNALLKESLKDRLLQSRKSALGKYLLQLGQPLLRRQLINIPSRGNFIARNGPIDSVNQQPRNAYNILARKAGPIYKPLFNNQLTNYQLKNDQLHGQNNNFYDRERLNIQSGGRFKLLKLLVPDSFNRRPAQSQSGNTYNKQKINLQQVRNNANYQPAASLESQNQTAFKIEDTNGMLNKIVGQNNDGLIRHNAFNINEQLKLLNQRSFVDQRRGEKLINSQQQQNVQLEPQNQAVFRSEGNYRSLNKLIDQNNDISVKHDSNSINNQKPINQRSLVDQRREEKLINSPQEQMDQLESQNQVVFRSENHFGPLNKIVGQNNDMSIRHDSNSIEDLQKPLNQRSLVDQRRKEELINSPQEENAPIQWPSELKSRQNGILEKQSQDFQFVPPGNPSR